MESPPPSTSPDPEPSDTSTGLPTVPDPTDTAEAPLNPAGDKQDNGSRGLRG